MFLKVFCKKNKNPTLNDRDVKASINLKKRIKKYKFLILN